MKSDSLSLVKIGESATHIIKHQVKGGGFVFACGAKGKIEANATTVLIYGSRENVITEHHICGSCMNQVFTASQVRDAFEESVK